MGFGLYGFAFNKGSGLLLGFSVSTILPRMLDSSQQQSAHKAGMYLVAAGIAYDSRKMLRMVTPGCLFFDLHRKLRSLFLAGCCSVFWQGSKHFLERANKRRCHDS